jgi:hypothetical protein
MPAGLFKKAAALALDALDNQASKPAKNSE